MHSICNFIDVVIFLNNIYGFLNLIEIEFQLWPEFFGVGSFCVSCRDSGLWSDADHEITYKIGLQRFEVGIRTDDNIQISIAGSGM